MTARKTPRSPGAHPKKTRRKTATPTSLKAKSAKPALAPRRTPPSRPAAGGAQHADGKWAEWFVRAPGERRYWLVKSEPEAFSFEDLERAPRQTTGWDGVRNFAARNFLRDGMRAGDLVFFYHSSTDPQAIVGVCEVVREGYPDPTALDPGHPNYDPDSAPNDPRWFQVDLRAVRRLARPVTLADLKAHPELRDMALLRIGRLSVTPVRASEWRVIEALG